MIERFITGVVLTAAFLLAAPAVAAERVALVVGVSDYEHLSPLANTVRDARAMAALLARHGFDVTAVEEPTHAAFETALASFEASAEGAEEAIVFYSGHGMTVLEGGLFVNALAPADADLDCATRQATRMVAMERIRDALEGVPRQVIIFDACRNDAIRGCEGNPLTAAMTGFQAAPPRAAAPAEGAARSVAAEADSGDDRGLAPIAEAASGSEVSTLLAYSTGLGQVALDGAPGGNSPFAAALLETLEANARRPLDEVLTETAALVAKTSGQRPWITIDGADPKMCLAAEGCETSDALRDAQSRTLSKFLAGLAQQAITQGDAVKAMLLALEALPKGAHGSRPYVAEAERAAYAGLFARRGLTQLSGHSEMVFRVALSPDSRRAMTSSKDEKVRLWDVESGSEVAVLSGHRFGANLIAFSADGGRAYTSGAGVVRVWDGRSGDPLGAMNGIALNFDEERRRAVLTDINSAKVLDLETGNEISVHKGHDRNPRVGAFSPDGRLVATASEYERHLRIWDAETGALVASLGAHEDKIIGLAFSPDSRRVAAVTNRLVYVWDLETGAKAFTLSGHFGRFDPIAFSPDGRRILTEGALANPRADLWDAETGGRIAPLVGHGAPLSSIGFSPDGRLALTASADGSVRLWDAETAAPIAGLIGNGAPVVDAVFSRDGRRVLSGAEDGGARIWNAETAAEVRVFGGHPGSVEVLAFSPDAQLIVTEGGRRAAHLWNVRSGAKVANLEGHTHKVSGVAFSADGGQVVAGSGNGPLRVWDTKSGKEIAVLTGHKGWLASMALNLRSRRLLTGSHDLTARLWDIDSWAEVAVLVGHTKPIDSVALSVDGRRAITGAWDNTARVWDAENGAEIAVLAGHSNMVTSVALSPDGRWALTGSEDKTARLWNAETGREIAVLAGHTQLIMSVAFSLDGTRAVTGSGDGGARLWDVETGALIASLDGHESAVMSVVFSPDGRRIVTAGSWDKTARVWDGQTGAEIAVLAGHTDRVFMAIFSPDGAHVLTGSKDKTARLWPLSPDAANLAARIKAVASRCLTPSERADATLPPEPERWCVTGAGLEAEADPAKWKPKWPYRTTAWREWLAARDRGEDPLLPETSEALEAR